MKVRQKGSIIAAILLILISTAVVSAAGYYVVHAHRNIQPAAKTAVNARPLDSAPIQSADPMTVSLKAYRNDEYGFLFRYPSDWKLSENLFDRGRGHAEGDVYVTSPNNTRVYFSPNLGGKGGDCWDDQANARTTRTCATLQIISVEKLVADTDAKPLVLVKGATTSSKLEGDKTTYFVEVQGGEFADKEVGSSLRAGSNFDQISDTKVGYVSIRVTGNDDYQNGSNRFFATNEVKEATGVLKSFMLLP